MEWIYGSITEDLHSIYIWQLMFRFNQNLCERITANFYICHGGFVLQESSLGNVFLSLRCCAWNGQFRVYLNIPVIFAGKLELRFIVQWNIIENTISISSSALRLCCIEKIIQVQNLIAGLLNYVRQSINGHCWFNLWKTVFYLHSLSRLTSSSFSGITFL